jgi:3-oxoacyl-[acyl-carrier protein] reductase
MTADMESKTCVVSGASGDIGLAVCKALLSAGHRVVGLYGRNADAFNTLADHGDAFQATPCPFDDPRAAQETLKAGLKPFKSIDALICCTGKTVRKPAMITSLDEATDLFAVNFLSAATLTQLVLRRMLAKRRGAIVYIGSRAGTHGLAGQAVYAASKGALASYAMSVAQEVGGKNISVNVIAPGAVHNTLNPKYGTDKNDAVTELIAMRRLAEPDEIAALASLLVSGSVHYLTGAVIPLDGGARF